MEQAANKQSSSRPGARQQAASERAETTPDFVHCLPARTGGRGSEYKPTFCPAAPQDLGSP